MPQKVEFAASLVSAGIANVVWMGAGSAVVEMPVYETHGRDMAHLSRSMGLDYWVTSGVKPFRLGPLVPLTLVLTALVC